MTPSVIETKTFAPSFGDLGLTRDLIGENLGYPPSRMPPRVGDVVDEIMLEASDHLEPKCGFVVLPSQSCEISDDRAACLTTELLMGDVIAPILKNAHTLAVFLVTAGVGADRWISSLIAQGETLRAVIADAVASLVAEQTAGWIEKRAAESAASYGWHISNRYSPGYCGWPTGDQRALFSLLPENFCGVRLTDSSFMVPLKSVSGVIGFGPAIKRTGYRCAICEMEDCFRRREEEPLQ